MDELSHIYFVGDDLPVRRPAGGRRAQRLRAPSLSVQTHRRTREDSGSPDPFFCWLFSKGGLDGTAYRPHALTRRLPACLRRLGVSSTQEAIALLKKQPGLASAAIGSVLIGVSEFFRDPEEFAHLRQVVLPSMLARKPRLRVLSAGCSDGQELYSIAMLLDERGALYGSDLLGVDCRADAIGRARSGVFENRDLATLPAVWRARCFQGGGGSPTVLPQLRAGVRWRVGDLLLPDEESSTWDVILFRNVAIYLHQPDPLWERLFQQMTPGGILMTGKAEQPPRSLPLIRESKCVYRKAAHA